MNYEEVTKEHMDALKALADVNLKVSEARNLLTKLQEGETEYLVSREKKAVDRIQSVLAESTQLLEETTKNYEVIHDLAKSVTQTAKFLSDAHRDFGLLIEEKDKHYEAWEGDIKVQEEGIVSLRNGLKVDLSTVESARKQVESDKISLERERKKIEDQRGTLARAVARLKPKM